MANPMQTSLAPLFILILIVSSSSLEETFESFIVRTHNDMKPTKFTDVDDWYTSAVQSLTNDAHGPHPNPQNHIFHVYRTIYHGFAARLTARQAMQLKSTPGILHIFPNKLLQLHTTRTPQFLGLANERNNLLKESDFGKDIIIGVVDTGIDPNHRSFADEGMGPIPPRWKGTCVKADNICNKKIIGARFFNSNHTGTPSGDTLSPIDTDGHGTHTASIAAGRFVRNVSAYGHAAGDASGIAPAARIAVYKVCWSAGCDTSDVLAGIDAAVRDGVDVLSVSIGGGRGTPFFDDPIAIGAFAAVQKGVFVAASAGNNGTFESTVENTAPWITTVGASTIDRRFPADLIFEDGTKISGQSLYTGPPLGKNNSFPIYYAPMNNNSNYQAEACREGELDPGMVRGKIVFCEYSNGSPVEISRTVREAGGIGVVLGFFDIFSTGETAEWLLIPGLMISQSGSREIIAYLNKTKSPHATISTHKTQLNVRPAPNLIPFSSRGPNIESLHILKPDLIAPGVNILAAWPNTISPAHIPNDERSTEFNIISGTSMSCPHVAGIAALLKGIHRDWSPAAIRSAMMTTAYIDNNGKQVIRNDEGAETTAWDIGAGHVDPQKASDPGLVYDLTTNDYATYLCNAKYNTSAIHTIMHRHVTCDVPLGKESDLNYPAISVVIDTAKRTPDFWETVERTVTYVGDGAANYTVAISVPERVIIAVEPTRLSFEKKGMKKKYRVRILAEDLKVKTGEIITHSGSLVWRDGKRSVTSRLLVVWQ